MRLAAWYRANVERMPRGGEDAAKNHARESEARRRQRCLVLAGPESFLSFSLLLSHALSLFLSASISLLSRRRTGSRKAAARAQESLDGHVMDGVGAEGAEAQREGEGEAGADEAEGWGGEGLGELRTETRRDWEGPIGVAGDERAAGGDGAPEASAPSAPRAGAAGGAAAQQLTAGGCRGALPRRRVSGWTRRWRGR